MRGVAHQPSFRFGGVATSGADGDELAGGAAGGRLLGDVAEARRRRIRAVVVVIAVHWRSPKSCRLRNRGTGMPLGALPCLRVSNFLKSAISN